MKSHINSFNLKEGDKVLCKKDYGNFLNTFPYFERGKTYTIYFKGLHQSEYCEIFFKIENDRYKFIKNNNFDEYFYTKEEIRKMKLEKLNNV